MLLARSMLFVFSMRSFRGEEALGLAAAAAAAAGDAGAGGGVGRAFFLGREGGKVSAAPAGVAGSSSDELSSEESDMFAGKGGPSLRGDCAPSFEETGEGGV